MSVKNKTLLTNYTQEYLWLTGFAGILGLVVLVWSVIYSTITIFRLPFIFFGSIMMANAYVILKYRIVTKPLPYSRGKTALSSFFNKFLFKLWPKASEIVPYLKVGVSGTVASVVGFVYLIIGIAGIAFGLFINPQVVINFLSPLL